jgi:hypothetical protein
MVTARNLAFVAAAAGALAGTPWSKAQACDNDRFPCPILSEAPAQDSADAPPAAPPQQSKKKPQTAQQGEKPASAKGERDNAQAAARPPSKQSGQDNAKRAARPGKPAPHEQANVAGAPPAPAAQVASPVPVIPEQLHNAATVRADSAPVLTRDASANAEGASGTPDTSSFNAQQVAAAGDFRLAERKEVNLTATAESSWLTYVLLLLGGLAAASTVRWFRSNTRGFNVLLARLHDRLGRISASS